LLTGLEKPNKTECLFNGDLNMPEKQSFDTY